MRILESSRLLFRHFLPDDLDSLYALYRDTDIRRYFPDGTLTYAQTKQELDWFLHGHANHPELGLWETIDKATAQFIGRCGLLPWTIDGRFEIELAFLMAKEYWGQGLGTEAALAISRYASQRLGYRA